MAEENEVKKESKFNQLFMTIIVALAIFFAAVFAATLFFINVVLPQREQYTMLDETGDQIKYMAPLGEDLVVNLADPTGRRFIRVNLTLVVDTPETQEEILRRKPQIRDVVIKIFRTKTVDKIREEEGILVIRNEILTAINNALPAGEVLDVFFTEFVYQ